MPITYELDMDKRMWRIEIGHYLFWSETRTEAELLVLMVKDWKWN